MRRRNEWLFVGLAAGVAWAGMGCDFGEKPSTQPSVFRVEGGRGDAALDGRAGGGGGAEFGSLQGGGAGPGGATGAWGGGDPVPAVQFAVRVDVWAIVVPRGTVSGNEAFWKRVDENAVPPDRYDLLFMNGFRVGVARQDDWDYFRDLLSRYPARNQLNAITVLEEQTVEVPVRRGVEEQTLSFFEPGKPVQLKTYDASENLLQFGFVPAPRGVEGGGGGARIALTPVVRSTRERLELQSNGSEKSIRYTAPERLYDLNLAVTVPFGEFLVCSPSTDTARQTSIGRNFLLMDGDAEQSEVVLLIAPTKVPLKQDK